MSLVAHPSLLLGTPRRGTPKAAGRGAGLFGERVVERA